MRIASLLIFSLIPAFGESVAAPAVAESLFQTVVHAREAKIAGVTYRVEYAVEDSGYSWVPATYPPGPVHYPAEITVYRVASKDTLQQVGSAFSGVWTPTGCYEDEPRTLVKKALEE